MAKQWFISDLHLSSERPDTLSLFEQFCREHPQDGDRVFILGDLFDAWIGDDDDGETANRVRNALRGLSSRGVGVFIQRGNRDFLMGKRLMRDCGAHLLPDSFVTTVAGKQTLLMHGDLLCTDDVDYQKARRRFRNPLFQWIMLRKSLGERRRIAAEYRKRSKEKTSMKVADIMDVNDDTVVRYLRKHGVDQLIHGHTHRPNTHQHRLADGQSALRLVLPEWHDDRTTLWVDNGHELQAITLTPNA